MWQGKIKETKFANGAAGGKREKLGSALVTDQSPKATALRELSEETGGDPSGISLHALLNAEPSCLQLDKFLKAKLDFPSKRDGP